MFFTPDIAGPLLESQSKRWIEMFGAGSLAASPILIEQMFATLPGSGSADPPAGHIYMISYTLPGVGVLAVDTQVFVLLGPITPSIYYIETNYLTGKGSLAVDTIPLSAHGPPIGFGYIQVAPMLSQSEGFSVPINFGFWQVAPMLLQE